MTGTSCSIIAFADVRASFIIGRTDLPMLLNIGVSSCARYFPISITTSIADKSLSCTVGSQSVAFFTRLRSTGVSLSEMAICAPSNADLKSVTSPSRLSSLISAIFSDAPVQFFIESVSLSKSSSLELINANSPDIPSFPAIAEAYWVFWTSSRSAKLIRKSDSVSPNDLVFPSESVNDIPRSSIAPATLSVGEARFVIIFLNDVPDCEPFIPAFAISPIAADISSMLYPMAPARGATYLNVSPIMPTLVFAFVAVCASTSAKYVLWSALIPKAVIASVTISEVVARSSPEAAAKFITPASPFVISVVFQPAIAIYSIACADSVAENAVVAPISCALALRISNSSPVAPDIAATVDICESKSIPALIHALPKSFILSTANAATTAAPIFFRALVMLLSVFSAVSLTVSFIFSDESL